MREQYRIPLAGCANFRDLGGYACANGRTTRARKFYRSNCLSRLTDSDIEAVEKLGISCVIDLRLLSSVENAANRLRGRNGILYNNISIVDAIPNSEADFPVSLMAYYIELLETSREKIVEVFHFFAANKDKTIVFHCTAGKDRTGVIAALLLSLAGVSRDDIVFDYALTKTYLWNECMQIKEHLEAKSGRKLADYIFEALPESMEGLLDYLDEQLGGANSYLLSCGVAETELDTIRAMIWS